MLWYYSIRLRSELDQITGAKDKIMQHHFNFPSHISVNYFNWLLNELDQITGAKIKSCNIICITPCRFYWKLDAMILFSLTTQLAWSDRWLAPKNKSCNIAFSFLSLFYFRDTDAMIFILFDFTVKLSR